jgi:hypothetical protein
MTNELYECSGARALTPEKDHLDVIDPSHPRSSLEGRPPSMESFEDKVNALSDSLKENEVVDSKTSEAVKVLSSDLNRIKQILGSVCD